MKPETETLKESFKTIESALVLGEFAVLADQFSMPTVAYSPARVVIIDNEAQLAEMFSNDKDLLVSNQVTQSHHQNFDEEPTKDQRKEVSDKFTKSHSKDESSVSNDVRFFRSSKTTARRNSKYSSSSPCPRRWKISEPCCLQTATPKKVQAAPLFLGRRSRKTRKVQYYV
ncbi:hypothetical protein [Boseongicola aestuarii]|uniref:Uncharacterized protein n=1 Tax=Boseongicola aestuarii TaxID=1470561 RepID=A0A238J1M6_9RHOB|nr:hypothetical protein [Boseongicola aestuarii]SMX24639.1 hypothetical protein BOA8489_02766 [Boseongicola aestuarii]